MELSQESCLPCAAGSRALVGDELRALASELAREWRVVDGRRLERRFEFPDFARALAFVNVLGELSERERHHPDLLLRWGSVTVVLWTHTIDGLSRADFVLAAKIELLCAAADAPTEP